MSDKEKFTFIEQEIKGNPRKQRKKMLQKIGLAAALGIIFGIIAALSFFLAENFLQRQDSARQRQQVSLLKTKEPSTSPITAKDKTEVSSAPQDGVTATPSNGQATINMEQYGSIYTGFQQIADDLNPSIVTVSNMISSVDWMNNTVEDTNAVYGLVIAQTEDKAYILTKRRQDEEMEDITVTFHGGSRFPATQESYDKESGLVILSVVTLAMKQKRDEYYQVACFGNSDAVSAGLPILVLGNPDGTMNSLAYGVVTGQGQEMNLLDNKVMIFKTDLPYVEQGEGVVVNLKGEIIGLITHKFETITGQEVQCFSGISELRYLIEQLVNGKRRCYFGINGNDLSVEYAKKMNINSGIGVREVKANSPAYEAGIIIGDVIYQVDGKEVSSMDVFYEIISARVPGDKVEVCVKRTIQGKTKEHKIYAVLEERK